MSYQYIYVMKELGKTFPGGKEVFKNIWLSFFPGAKIGIIGSNGSGKSTLLKIMAGIDKEFRGEAFCAKDVKIGYLPQEPEFDPSKTVYDVVMEGAFEINKLIAEFNEISEKFLHPLQDDEMNLLLEQQAVIQDLIDQKDGWELDRYVTMAMDALRCPPKDQLIQNLSGGEKRRVALCHLLIQKPDLLLLDEPTNHLDAESVSWLEEHLKEYKGTIVLITHDRYFLDNVVGWILELDRGDGIPFEGNYSAWLENKQKRLTQEKQQQSSRDKQIDKELEWIRQSPKGRQSKSKARISAYESLLDEKSKEEIAQNAIYIPEGPRLGDIVIEASHVTKTIGERVLINDLSFSLPKGGIIGIIGPNGAGKSTLVKILTGQISSDSGDVRVGETVKVAYVDQERLTIDNNKTVFHEISEGLDIIPLGKREVPSRAYCSWFGFKGPDQQKKMSMLSGGERNRVHLAKVLRSGGNVLFLDEPTNDLDVDTLRALEEAILNFCGCCVIISHDRFFLDRVATHILSFEGDGKVTFFFGNYQEYEEDYKQRHGSDINAFKHKALAS